jgi:hypothetical protein
VETPPGIVYSTPFTATFSPKISKAPPSPRTPTDVASANVPRHNDNLYLVWNGHTKDEFEAMHREAHELDRSGKVEDAEAKFREALEGLEHVLSPTHNKTNTVAYHLAEFLANQARMSEADTVLNWMGEKQQNDSTSTACVGHVSQLVSIRRCNQLTFQGHGQMRKYAQINS